MDSYDLPSGGSFSVAGYESFGGDWNDVEAKGDTPFEESGYDLSDLDRVTIHYTDSQGNDFYLTVNGPWDDWDVLGDIIDDALDSYGVTA